MMLGTGHINYLDRSELEYEVMVRGYLDVADKKMEDLRKILRKYLKKDVLGSRESATNLKEEDEVTACQQKLKEIENLLGLLSLPSSGTDIPKLKRKLSAVLCHISDRIKRIGDGAQGQLDLKEGIENCISNFQKITQRSLQTNASGKSDYSLSEVEGAAATKSKFRQISSKDGGKQNNMAQSNSSSSDSVNTEVSKRSKKKKKILKSKKKHTKEASTSDSDSLSTEEEYKKKSRLKMKKIIRSRRTSSSSTDDQDQKKKRTLKATPVRFWNIKFSGDDNTSVGAFLADVEDRRVANNMSFRELFQAAGELFTGSALAVYRSCRGRIDDWHGLEVKLRSAFQDPDYDRRLLREIENRKQGSDETITVYIAKMRSLFSRLTKPKSELDMLDIIEENVLPNYQSSLSLQNYDSIDTLENILQRLERGHLRAQRFESRPSRTLLEPDLAYKPRIRKENIKISTMETLKGSFNNKKSTEHKQTSSTCWNCKIRGHHYSDCRKPKSVFCYGCGRENTIKSKCPSCRNVLPERKSENFVAERRQSGPRFVETKTQTD